MTEAEKRILKNQVEILWVMNIALGKMLPDLVGRGGEVDQIRDDLKIAAKDTSDFIERSSTQKTEERR